MVKKLALSLLVAVLAVTGLVVEAKPAQAASFYTHLTTGWSLWTREYCMDGQLVTMRRMHFGSKVQGREYVYRRGGRLCVFAADHLTGSHHIRLFAKVPGGGYSEDDGTYTAYAGAFGAPKGRCVWRGSTLFLGDKGYRTDTAKIC